MDTTPTDGRPAKEGQDGEVLDRPAAKATRAPAVRDGRPRSVKVDLENGDTSSLYAEHIKIYPKSVSGRYRTIKWAVLALCLAVYYTVPWLRWDRGPGAPGQAVLIDLSAPRAYFFGIEIWPQEVYYITGLLVLAAVGLFLVTALAGRVWCGYACPQTVWTDLFMAVERWIEGDRGARIRLDGQPWTREKLLRKTAKHAAWLAISVATGGAWILYFDDAPTALRGLFTGQATISEYFFVGLFTATTYTLAGWAREQVCTYMCPWPRIQGSMLDVHSLVVTYEAWRGERRGPHKAGTSWEGRGDCIDCGQCIAVCPTGIDIRDGQQLECIGCGLCIDSCNDIMAKVGRPPNLIRFDTLANQEAKAQGQSNRYRLLRPRVVIYALVLAVVGGVMLTALETRTTMGISVLRDRAPLFVTLSNGALRNGYTIKVMNKRRGEGEFRLGVVGQPGATVAVQDVGEAHGAEGVALTVPGDAVATFRVFVSLPRQSMTRDGGAQGSIPLVFSLTEQGPTPARPTFYEGVFMGPGAKP
ncbi:cytochrome c oxidase accessory protein CcoG [Nitrospirillum sp. BR 11164]|uniref:cytochrome c oxidase accessory protein CcoG n=1 Tax=Nitrospirillum sp. BR 11164 TaxID=3104324 RepID=UPI002B000450|nr:cytochrome c oxidase accessory protein CcoG [Nitrospirillum sp. BR 11164]MEA1651032.1 cytochrome c oxidase accessory protein CcoG [Nitrospirillum sp. BR 11164]